MWTEIIIAAMATAGIVLGIYNALNGHFNQRKRFLGFLSHFNLWNWYPGDVGPSDPRYGRWVEQIDQLFEYRGFVPSKMKSQYNEMCALYSKSRVEGEDRKRVGKLTNQLREEANKKFMN